MECSCGEASVQWLEMKKDVSYDLLRCEFCVMFVHKNVEEEGDINKEQKFSRYDNPTDRFFPLPGINLLMSFLMISPGKKQLYIKKQPV